MKTLDVDPFITELTHLFTKHKTTTGGSLYITLKRLDSHTKTKKKTQKATSNVADGSESAAEPRLLVRASCGVKRKRKLNVAVCAKDVNRFNVAFGSALRSGIDGLKKKEKVKDVKGVKPSQPVKRKEKSRPSGGEAPAKTAQAQAQTQRSPAKKAKASSGKPTQST